MTKPRLFGTDGLRGSFGTYPLDEPTVRRLGVALARRLRAESKSPRVVMGGDTRDSTPVLSRFMAESLEAGGVPTTYLGTISTPGVAQATVALGAACGVAISASHNPHPDNGIKMISSDGFKWPPEWEAEIETQLEAEGVPAGGVPAGGDVELRVDEAAVRGYLDALAGALPAGRPLAGLKVAVDAGHGAASAYVGPFLERLGATVALAHAAPDGTNINAGCGSTHPEVIAELTKTSGADLGLSFDGDADRVILADEKGEVRDGDAMLYLWALDLASRDVLPGNRIVATSMSNLGLEVALRRAGVEIVRCDVGDRTVVATMREQGVVLGGEQSGHVVNLDLSTTGDGLLTGLKMAHLRVRQGRPLSQMLAGFERFPQILHNVRVREKPPLQGLPAVAAAAERVADALGDEGRLVLRYSGTEPLARIMIEGPDRGTIESLAAEIETAIVEAIGA